MNKNTTSIRAEILPLPNLNFGLPSQRLSSTNWHSKFCFRAFYPGSPNVKANDLLEQTSVQYEMNSYKLLVLQIIIKRRHDGD
jgi:hypothetical protein